jgi:hypothetical protein
MFCKYFTNLQTRGIPKGLYYFKKFDDYMTRLPIIIQKMHNENKVPTLILNIHKSKFIMQEL